MQSNAVRSFIVRIAAVALVILGCGSAKTPPTATPAAGSGAQPLEQAVVDDAGAAAAVQASDAASPVLATTPFLLARDCAAVKASPGTPPALLKVPAKLRKLTKVAPASNEMFFNADGTLVIYADAMQKQVLAVPVSGGTAKPLDKTQAAMLEDAALQRTKQDWQAKTRGDVLPLSSKLFAIGIGDRAEKVRQHIADVTTGRLTPVAADGLYSLWSAQRVDDHRVAFIGRDSHMYVADGAAQQLVCASVKTAGEIGPFFAAQSDYVVFAAGRELHAADTSTSSDRVVAVLPDDAETVVIQPVPYAPLFWNKAVAAPGSTFVVHVELRKAKQMHFFLVDAKTGKVERIADPQPGWSNMWVAPDGKHVVFTRGQPFDPNARPPKPPALDRTPDPDGPGTCDRMGCGMKEQCGWQSDGCYDYVWCGPCPGDKRPSAPPATDGIYVIAL